MSLTEAYVIKAAVEKPVTNLDYKALNISGILKGEESTSSLSDEMQQKLILRMFYRVWSGLTKYIRTIIVHQRKAVAFNEIGILQPMLPPLNGLLSP